MLKLVLVSDFAEHRSSSVYAERVSATANSVRHRSKPVA